MLITYLIVSLVIVGSIIVTPSFLIRMNSTSPVTSECVGDTLPSLGIKELLQLKRDNPITNTQNLLFQLLPVFPFIGKHLVFRFFIFFYSINVNVSVYFFNICKRICLLSILSYNPLLPSASIVHFGHSYLWNIPLLFHLLPQLKHVTHTINAFVIECFISLLLIR